ncbi:bidirectional sugar transporter SWEET6b-like [Euphorbia lathyris]|uniref:bidirectional sugar transporter SWEET6b-like n=1 Tax=Euphorbia lathyris TaxID=212925 RepID=UPI003313D9B9
MISARAIRNIIGIIGNVISFGLFLSPVPTFIRIIKKKDVEEFQFYPYILTVQNCMFWVFYGLPIVKADSILVVTINSVGLVLELIYLAIFCFYDKHSRGRRRVFMGLCAELVFTAIVVVITLCAFHTLNNRTLFAGIFAVAFNIIMYGSPLLIMRKVIKTKSVEYMPLFLSVASFTNGCIWTAYSCIYIFDPIMLTSNGLGSLFGLAQLILYARYYKSTPQSTNVDVEKASEIQLSGSNAAVRI